ncbi:transcription factor SAC51-like [Phalaenopsis equestris]|uniref:transcription factor SAC51-like n=1 Tax=Phalaenopsis equestris TaxID=78828 RepID=UPI0009E3B591|nr:transcription factor SAC51-like [Phalaenopsis equestris]XP_020578860.1 transcription factor SAC51-like [Phalaenopsis equestris]
MWEFSNLNTGNTLWPPDAGQQQNSINPYVCSFSVNPNEQLTGFGTQGSFLHFDSPFYCPPLNPLNSSSEQQSITQTKKFLIFDHSGDQTSLVFSSVANPFEGLNPPLPLNYAHESKYHEIEEEEMHENTEEIDALLYSDSEYIDDEETSTGHSPFDMAEEDITSSHIPCKRRRVSSTDFDSSLVDTASSVFAPRSGYVREEDDLAERNKKERIKQTVRVLRKIIPGGDGKDTVSVLDEAIQYLKLLKLRAKSSLSATSLS